MLKFLLAKARWGSNIKFEDWGVISLVPLKDIICSPYPSPKLYSSKYSNLFYE